MAICGARKRGGGICRQPPGHQTVHKGVGRCRFHEESDPLFPYKFQSRKLTTNYGMCRELNELRAFRALDRNPRVTSYTIEPFKIPYGRGRRQHYIPDLLVKYSSGVEKLVEVKTSLNVGIDEYRVKYRLGIGFAQKRGLKYEVWVCKIRRNGRLDKDIFDSNRLLRRLEEAERREHEILT